MGALLDGIPESAVIGVSLIGGGGVGAATVVAIFISNLPEGLSSAVGMKGAGRSARYVFGVWGGIALASGLAALAGYLSGSALGPAGVAVLTAIAGGAILAMLTDTMIPEAVEGDAQRHRPDRRRGLPRGVRPRPAGGLTWRAARLPRSGSGRSSGWGSSWISMCPSAELAEVVPG